MRGDAIPFRATCCLEIRNGSGRDHTHIVDGQGKILAEDDPQISIVCDDILRALKEGLEVSGKIDQLRSIAISINVLISALRASRDSRCLGATRARAREEVNSSRSPHPHSFFYTTNPPTRSHPREHCFCAFSSTQKR